MDHSLQALARAVQESDRLVWLTGAGLSVASGIPAYRTGAAAVWDRMVTEWGTKARFRQDPLAWWREFWLGLHDLDPRGRRPNLGHDAITTLVGGRPKHLVVTQNVDGLHARSGVRPAQLIEIHGRHGLYRCTEVGCQGFLEPATHADVDLSVIERGELPRCAACAAPLRPLVLLFDETYDSHPYFRSDEAFRALERADAIVFVGTSHAVGVTEIAVQMAARRRVPAFHVNIAPHEHDGRGRPTVIDVLGRAEELLPRLLS